MAKSKIIMVDDEVDLTKLAQIKLEQSGYDCIVLNSSEKAFETVKAENPDLVILDVMMPGETGYEICRKLRRDPITYTVPVLIFTALGQEPEILHGLEQGADDYLVKPFSPERLLERVSSLLELKETIEKLNSLTNLPGTEAIKREINHRLARGATFAVCYIDVLQAKPYRQAYGNEKYENLVQETAKLIQSLPDEMDIFETYSGHMGGEHFIAVVKIPDYERYCQAIIEEFDKLSRTLYKETDRTQGHLVAKDRTGQPTKFPLMSMSIGVVHNEVRKFKNAAKVFEVLAQVKHKAEKDGKGIIFVDRRRSDR